MMEEDNLGTIDIRHVAGGLLFLSVAVGFWAGVIYGVYRLIGWIFS